MNLRGSRRTKRSAMVEINVVPYIDVMLVLLIIFMITAPMLTQGVKVDLPNAAAKKIPPTENKPLIVTVNKQGDYFINQKNRGGSLSASELQQTITEVLQADSNKQVYVRGDKNAQYGQVVEVMVLLQKAGVSSVGLVTDDQSQE